MKTTRIPYLIIVMLLAAMWSSSAGQASPMGTTITYQGRLIADNVLVDGQYDFRFSLYDEPNAGSQQGSSLIASGVEVIDGYFTVELDFGEVFSSEAMWLDIGVREGALEDPNEYTALTPRQRIRPSPQALYSKTAGALEGGLRWDQILGMPAGFADGVDDGLTVESDPTVAASVKDGVSWAEISGIPAGFADGVDDGLTSESDPQVGTNATNYVPKWNGSALVTGTMYDNGNIGIGTTSPAQKLHVVGNAYISSTVYEGGTALSDKYLGKTATAVNSDTLDGYHASSFVQTSLVGSGSINEADTVQDTLVSMTSAGWTLKDDGDTDNDHTLILSTTSSTVEYTLWYGSTVTNGEASYISPATITFPHYTGFQLILARPVSGYIMSLVCKENDNRLLCVYHKSHP